MRRHVPYADPGTPDSRGPVRYLWWLVRMQRSRVLLGSLWASLGMCSLTLPPYLTARAIDDGLRRENMTALVLWAVAVLGIGVVTAVLSILRHRTMTFVRTDAALRTVQLVVRQSVRLGAALTRRVTSGELATVQAADVGRIAQTLTIAGPGVGSVIAYTVVAILLFGISPLLAVVVLVGVPVLVLMIGPLLRRLRGVDTRYRERQGALTAFAGDTVAGLRVLSGVGGAAMFGQRYRARSAELRDVGYRVGAITSWIQAVGACLPVLFVGVVVWLAAREAMQGAITVGEMVAVYGYVAILIIPVSFFIEAADDLVPGTVSAGRVIRILAMTPEVEDVTTDCAAPDTDGRPTTRPGPSGPADLRDPASGLVVPAGRLCALVCAASEDATGIVDRLGRYVESDAMWGGARLRDVAVTEVRRRILVADHDAYLFAGALRDCVDGGYRGGAGGPTGRPRSAVSDREIEAAMRAASADDIVAALGDGLHTLIEPQGRNLSGGQRQRIRLVRVLLAEPEVLLLVEPTSAVDALTEAAMIRRLREWRQGRTTLVVGTSPLLLDQADQVAYVVDGVVSSVGTHAQLLETEPGYRALVFRGSEEDDVSERAAL